MRTYLRTGSRVRFMVYSGLIILASGASAYLWLLDSEVTKEARDSVQRMNVRDIKSADLAKKMQAKHLAEENLRKHKAKEAAELAADEAAKGKATPAMLTADSPCNTSLSRSNPLSVDVMVNKKHCLKPIGFAPSDLRVILGTTLRAEAATRYEAMVSEAAQASIAIRSTSSYRSYDQQISTYNYWVAANGSVAMADTVSARPGYSEHQTGLTVDLASGSCVLECFGTTPAYGWMMANAANYGFIERYPAGKTSVTGYSPEPWHFRYVGESIARDMKTKNVYTLEEYWNMPGGDY